MPIIPHLQELYVSTKMVRRLHWRRHEIAIFIDAHYFVVGVVARVDSNFFLFFDLLTRGIEKQTIRNNAGMILRKIAD